MTIMMKVNGSDVWTEEEGLETSPADLLGVLVDCGLGSGDSCMTIGSALVNGTANVTTDEGVVTISIY